MRFIAMAFLLMGLVISGLAASNHSKAKSESECAPPGHVHQYSDVRMAMIEVTDVTSCGFSYADLEANTVGLDNVFHFSPVFEMIKLEEKDKKTMAMLRFEMSKKAVKKGLRGLATYCVVCKTVFNFRLYGNLEISNLPANP